MELRWFSNDYHCNHNCLSECNQWGSTIINNYDHRMAITIIYHWSNYNCFSSFLHWLCQPGQSTRSRIINPANTPPWTHLYTHTCSQGYIIYIYIYLFIFIFIFIYVYPHTLIPSGRLVRRPSFRHCCGGFGVGGVGFGGMRFWRGWGGRNNVPRGCVLSHCGWASYRLVLWLLRWCWIVAAGCYIDVSLLRFQDGADMLMLDRCYVARERLPHWC